MISITKARLRPTFPEKTPQVQRELTALYIKTKNE